MNKEVEILNISDIEKYIEFIKTVFGYEPNEKDIKKLIKKSKVLIVKDNEKIVSSICIEERYEYIKGQKYYFLSYLGTLKEYRRNGYASLIFKTIEEMVKENNINYLELTSGNQRRSAHYFYKSKEFKIKDTTVFVKIY